MQRIRSDSGKARVVSLLSPVVFLKLPPPDELVHGTGGLHRVKLQLMAWVCFFLSQQDRFDQEKMFVQSVLASGFTGWVRCLHSRLAWDSAVSLSLGVDQSSVVSCFLRQQTRHRTGTGNQLIESELWKFTLGD